MLPRPQQLMIQRQLTSEALNSGQMLEVCVLSLVGGRVVQSKGENIFPQKKEKGKVP